MSEVTIHIGWLSREVAADIWDEGYIAASGDALRDEGCEVFVEDADNPYREE